MKIIFAITILFFLFSFNFISATGITVSCEYNYPWCDVGTETPAGLISSFYEIALGLAGAAALGVLIYGALLWTLSGAVTSKQDAKEWISGALSGLVLLLGAFLIFNTINPDLVELRDPGIEPIPEELRTPEDLTQIKIEPCLFCVRVHSCSNLESCEANSRLAANLRSLDRKLKRADPQYSWTITEAWRPTFPHAHPCHANGMCVDANFRPPTSATAENIILFIQKADESELRAVYEVGSSQEEKRLENSGVPAANIIFVPPKEDGTPSITAPHFSVYLK